MVKVRLTKSSRNNKLASPMLAFCLCKLVSVRTCLALTTCLTMASLVRDVRKRACVRSDEQLHKLTKPLEQAEGKPISIHSEVKANSVSVSENGGLDMVDVK